MLHKIRLVMVESSRKLLSGKVEIGEAWIAAKKRNLNGRNRRAGPTLLIAVEVIKDIAQLGRIRIKSVSSNSGLEIESFVKDNVAPGSHLYTDGSTTYQRFTKERYQLTQTAASLIEDGQEVLPHVNLFVSLLKNWLQGPHQGRWSVKHLQAYLDEFVFRFNRRTSDSRSLLFLRVVEAGVQMPSPTYTEMIDKKRSKVHKHANLVKDSYCFLNSLKSNEL